MAAEKLDWKTPKAQPPVQVASPEEALDAVKQAGTEAMTAYLAVLAPLAPAERSELQRGLNTVLTEQNQVGHTLSDRGSGRRLLHLLEKTNRSSIYAAARALIPLTDVQLLKQLRELPAEGNVTVEGAMGLGFAWDMSVSALCDFAGNDRYEAARQNTQGCGAQAGLGILFDYEGKDVYLGRGQGYASPSISYHSQSTCGGNFSFLVDYGGKDEYGCGVENNSYNQRGSKGGFLIDRPTREEEVEQQPANLPAANQKKDG